MGDKQAPVQTQQEVPSRTLSNYDYSQHTIPQLKEMLDERGIAYKSNLLKAEYIKLLEGGET